MNNISKRWRALWQPDMYHGWGKTRRYFEGWYVKIVDPSEQHVFAIIPGISMDADGSRHAFIQLLDGIACKASYIRFDAEEFVPSEEDFGLQLGGNYFSADRVVLDLEGLRGEIQFEQRYPWPKMLGAPGIMGWYSFIPFMECYHGVVSMNHWIRGHLNINGQEVNFAGGKGYMEKDWGISFPRCWIWTQTNHFEDDQQISLMASVASIPWLSSHFVGYIVGFLYQGHLYRFATYTGAKMKARLKEDRVELAFKDRKNRLELTAIKGPGSKLVSPISGEMTGKVNESMQAKVHVRLFQNDQLLYEGTGRNAGLEVAGETEVLLTEKWRR
ncbi:MAG: tocopherol cyclase family protein [Bacteroidota bacterium]